MPAPAPATNIAFDSGHAAPTVLPDFTVEAERALSAFRAETLQYAPRPGLPELRSCIAELMANDGARVSPEQLLVTNGAKHAIELICRVLLDEGDSIVVTAPTYFTAIPIFRSFGARFIEVGSDRDGLDVAELADVLQRMRRGGERLPKFIYNVPDFHNPTGVTMPSARRQALIDLATEHRLLIVEDSPYRKVRFDGESEPSLAALNRDGTVFHVGTFSKLMAPGLRVGWVAATPEMISRLIQLKSDGGSCPLTQRMIIEFVAGGRLTPHIARVQATYRAQRDRMVAALCTELPEAAVDVPSGGYYLWVTLPERVDGDALAKRAHEAGVTVLAGSKFFARADGGHPRNHIRLAYSHATVDEIDEGVRRLARAFRALSTERVVAASG
jgi:2-aminoadipate transaminase